MLGRDRKLHNLINSQKELIGNFDLPSKRPSLKELIGNFDLPSKHPSLKEYKEESNSNIHYINNRNYGNISEHDIIGKIYLELLNYFENYRFTNFRIVDNAKTNSHDVEKVFGNEFSTKTVIPIDRNSHPNWDLVYTRIKSDLDGTFTVLPYVNKFHDEISNIRKSSIPFLKDNISKYTNYGYNDFSNYYKQDKNLKKNYIPKYYLIGYNLSNNYKLLKTLFSPTMYDCNIPDDNINYHIGFYNIPVFVAKNMRVLSIDNNPPYLLLIERNRGPLFNVTVKHSYINDNFRPPLFGDYGEGCDIVMHMAISLNTDCIIGRYVL